MKKTVDQYFDEKQVMDIEVISTLGLTNDDLEEIENIEGVLKAEGTYSLDAITKVEKEEYVVKVISLPENINQVKIIEGRLPQDVSECVVEESFLQGTKKKIGEKISLENKESEISLLSKEMTIVGTVQSPMYLSRDRGSSKLGSGKINYYMYVPKEEIDSKVFTGIEVICEETKELDCFSKKYTKK